MLENVNRRMHYRCYLLVTDAVTNGKFLNFEKCSYDNRSDRERVMKIATPLFF